MAIERLRRRPEPTSESRKRGCTGQSSAGGVVRGVLLVADDVTVVELEDAAPQVVDDVMVVRRHDDRRAGPVDAVEQPHDVEADALVEVAGGLVAQQDLRAVDHCSGDRDPLLLTTGELVRETPLLAAEAHHLERLGDELPDDVPRLPDDLEGVGDVLVDGLVGQQPEVLEDRAHLAAQPWDLAHRHGAEVVPGDEHGALGRRLLTQGEAEHRRLPRPRRADDEDELPAVDVDRHVLDRGTRRPRVDLGDVVEADHARRGPHGGRTADEVRDRDGHAPCGA